MATDLSRARRCATMRARASPTAASRARRAPDSRSRARRAAPPSARIALRRRSARRCAGVACSSDARRPVEPRRPTLLRQDAARRGGAPSSSLDELSDESGEPAGGGGGGALIWAASSASMRASAASAAATSAAVGLLGDAVGAGVVGVGAGAAGGAAFFVGVSSSSSLRTASAFSFDARGRRCGERERGAAIGVLLVACARRGVVVNVVNAALFLASLGPRRAERPRVVRAQRKGTAVLHSGWYAAVVGRYLVRALCKRLRV